jgi:hypothetical protein
MKKSSATAGDSLDHAPSVSRLLDSDAGLPGDADDWPSVHYACESCHWAVVETRRFKGRELCLSCIAEYFSGDSDEE